MTLIHNPPPHAAQRVLFKAPILLYQLGLGDVLNLFHIMVFAVRGRTSGQPRHTPLEYRRHGSKTYVISAWGMDADWVKNLQANGDVLVQQGQKYFRAQAEIVTDSGEAARALNLFRKSAPRVYDPLITRLAETDGLIPNDLRVVSGKLTIVRFTPVQGISPLPPVMPTLSWVLPAVSVVIGLWVLVKLISGLRGRGRS